MCGIFGTINYKSASKSEEIFRGLLHRGPDEQNHVTVNNLELYHTRLAIQDLTPSGRQPMEHNGLYIVFNGEIYNHLELRAKYNLEDESNSDTKTILLLFDLLGIGMLSEFDGMFAFILYDAKSNEVFIARDRAGKKPLYYFSRNEQLVISSELNTLNQVVQPGIDKNKVSTYLYRDGGNSRIKTPYKDVFELESGTFLKIDLQTGQKTSQRWWNIQDFYLKPREIKYEDALKLVDEHLHIAIRRRIDSSDLDVGAFLSGGIDSGLVTAIAAEHSSNLRTFTVRMEGAYDESKLAQQVADRYKTNHTIVDISFSDLKNDIESILINYGEPFSDSSAIPSYYVAKEAKKHITVVLNGDGADELFGGYRRYVPFMHYDFLNSNSFVRSFARGLTSVLPIANEKKSRYNYIYRLLKLAGYENPSQVYSSATSDLFVGFEDQFINRPELQDAGGLIYRVKDLAISPLKKILLLDFETILFGGLLPKMDIATMAHSLEGRSPFLSKEILELAPTLSDSFKINKVETKHILRDLARKYLPADLINQPKRGFEIPLKSWVDGMLKEIIEDYLLSKAPFYSNFLKRAFIENLINRNVKISDERRAKILYTVFSFEVWYKSTTKVKYRDDALVS